MNCLRLVLVIGASFGILIGATPGASWAQTSGGESVDAAHAIGTTELSGKAQRYYNALKRSPQPGLIFERFCDAWLTDRSAEGLEIFLRQRSEAGDPADQLIFGFFFAREGRNVEALRVFRQTLENHPGHASAWYFKAEIETATLDFDTALSDLASAAAAKPNEDLAADIAELRGRLLVRVGRRDEGLAVWAQLLEQRPNDPGVYENLVVIQVEEGLFDQAIETLEQLIGRTEDPQKRVGRQLWRGDVLQQAGRKDAALEAYEATLNEVGSGGWLERQVLAQIEQVFRREQELEEFSQRLADLSADHPERIELLRRRARVLHELDKTDESIEQWKALLERAPGDRELRGEFADVLADANRTQEAIDLVEVLLADRPDDGELRLRLAGLYKEADRKQDAVDQVRLFVNSSDGSLSSVVRAARVLERLELDTSAEALLRERLTGDMAEPGLAEALAELLYRIDKQDEAVAMWREMASSAQESADLLEAVRAMASRGQAAPAQEALVERIEAFSDDPEVLGALADVSLRGGDPTAAVPRLRQWVRAIDDPQLLQRAVGTASRVARAAEQDDELIAELSDASSGPRGDGETWLLASLYEQTGDSPAADAVLDRAVGDDEPSEALVRARIDLLSGRGDYTRAAEALRELVERPGGARSVLLRELIDLYTKDLRIEDALTWIERWKQVSPGSITPWLRQASLLEGEGRDKDVIQALERASRQFPEDVSVSSKLAESYVQQGRESDALRVYWRLYDAAESTAGKLSWVAKLAQTARFGDGGDHLIKQFEQRRDQDRNSVEPYLALAEVYRVLDRYEDRRASLMEAARVQPESLELLLTIARTEQQAGDLEQAAATLRRAMPLDSGGRVRQQLAALHVYLGQNDRAIALLNDPETGGPTVEQAMAFADALMGQNEWEAAANFLRPIVESHPNDYRLAYLYGVALTESLQTGAATEAFLSVLEINEEPPSNSATQQDPFASYTRMLQRMMPDEAMVLIRQQWATHRATSHRQNQVYYTVAGQLGSQQIVTPPFSYIDAHALAIAHLQLIADESDESRRDELAAAMKSRGVALAGVLLDMIPGPHGGIQLTPEVVEEYRDEPAVLAMGVFMSNRGQNQLDPELLQHASEMFAEDWPPLTLMASLSLLSQGGVDGEPAAELWPDIERQLDAITDPPDMLIPMLVSYTGTLPGQGSVVDLTDEQRDFLMAKLRAWYGAMNANSQYRPWLQQMISMAMVQAEDWEQIGAFMVEETRRHREKPGARGQRGIAAQMRMMQQGQGMIRELDYPPKALTSIPAELMSLLGGQNMYGMPMVVDHEALLGVMPDDTPPLLLALIAGSAEDGDALTAALEPVLTGPEPTLDAFVIRAAWDGREGQPIEAAKGLIRASYLPMARTDRQIVDGATVAYALAAGDDLDEDTESSAQRAALRLRQSAATYEQRTAVVEALADLGLEEEAERMEERLASASPASTSMPRYVGHQSLSGTERIRDLLAEDRREDAVKMAYREVNTLAQNVSTGNAWMLQNSDAQSLLTLVRSRDMVEEIIAEADPGRNIRGQRGVMFGVVLELLDQQDRAIELYRRIMADRPDPGAALQLFMIEVQREDPAAAAAVLSELSPRMSAQVNNQLMQQIHFRANDDPGFILGLAEAAALWIEASDEPSALPVNWTANLWHWVASRQYYSGRQLPHLYDTEAWAQVAAHHTPDSAGHADTPDTSDAPPADDSLPEPDFNVELQRNRMTAHDRLARALLRIPSLAPDAAARLALSAELRGESLEGPADQLQAAIQLKPSRIQPGGMMHYSYGMQYQPNVLPLRTAAEALAIYAAQNDQPQRIEQVARTLRDQRRKNEAEQIEALHALHVATPEAFLPAAEAWAKISRRTPGQGSAVMRPVFDAWIDDGHPDIDLEPMLLEIVGRAQHGSQDTVAVVLDYARELAERDGPPAAGELIERFTTVYIGPSEKRADLIEKHFSSSHWQPTSINGKMQVFVQVMRQAAETPQLAWAALDQLAPYAASPKASGQINYDYLVREVFENIFERAMETDDPAAALIAEIDDSPLLADAPGFRSYAYESQHHGRSGIDLIRRYVDNADDDEWGPVVDEVLTWIESRPPTLGTALTRSALRNDSLADSLAGLLPHQDAITQLGPAAQNEIIAALPEMEGDLGETDPAVRALAEVLGGVRGDTLTDRAQQILDIRALNPYGNQEWELGRGLPSLALSLYSEGRQDTAFQLLEHWNELLRKQQRNRGHSNGQNAEYIVRRTLDGNNRHEENAEQHLTALMLFTDAAQRPDLGLGLESWTLNASRNRLNELMDKTEPIEGEQDKQLRLFAAGLDRLAGQTGSRHAAPLFFAIYREAEDRHKPENYEQGLALLAERRATDETANGGVLEPGSFWVTAEAALRLARWKEADDDHPALEEDLAFVDRYCVALADDPGLPVKARLGLLREAASHLNRDMPPTATAAAGRLMVQTLREDPALVNGSVAEKLFETLWTVVPGDGRPTDAELVEVYLKVVGRKTRANEDRLLRVGIPQAYNIVSASNHLSSPRASLIALDMALEQGMDGAIEKLLRLEDHRLATSPATWALLAQHGRAGLAAEAIRRNHSEARPVRVWGIVYTPALAEATPDLLAALEGDRAEELRFFTEAALASLADIADDENDPRYPEIETTYADLPNRSERLTALAERFESAAVTHPLLRTAVLVMLSSDDRAAVLLEAPLTEATDSVTLASLAESHDGSTEITRQLIHASLVGAMHRGDPAPLIAEIEALNEGAGISPHGGWQTSQQHDQLKRLFIRQLSFDDEADGVGMKPENLISLRDAWALMLRPDESMQHARIDQRDLARLIVLYALDPEADPNDYEAWFDQTPSHIRTRNPREDDVRTALREIVKHPSISPGQRVETVARAMAMVGESDGRINFERLVFNDKILTTDQLAEHGNRLTATLPPRSQIDLATALARGEHAAADSAWDQAAQTVADASDSEAYEVDKLFLIQQLVRHKQFDRAKVEQADWEPSDTKIKDQLEKVRQKHFTPTPETDTPENPPTPVAEASPPQETP